MVKPLPLVKQYMIQARGRDTAGVTKVKGHDTGEDVEHGRVRLADKVGNAEADAAADVGRRHQFDMLKDAMRKLLKVRNHWYTIMLQLHRFMIAVARVTVNHDGRGGTAPDPLVYDQGGQRITRRMDIRVNVDLASHLVLLVSWMDLGCRFTGVDLLVLILLLGPVVLASSASLLPFLNMDMGHFGVSYLEVLVLFEQRTGHRLLSEKVLRPHLRADRLVSFPSACTRGN